MTITRLRQTGFETNVMNYEVDGTSTSGPTIAALVTKTGGYSMQYIVAADRYWYWSLAVALSQARTSLHLYTGTPSGGVEVPDIVGFYSGTTPIIRVQATATGIRVVVGASTVAATAAVTPFATAGNWVHVSVDVKVLATTGWVRIYVDGVQVVDFSGTTNTAGATFDSVSYGPRTSAQNYTTITYMDDVYLDNTTDEVAPTFAPDRRFLLVLPNGDGNSSQWTGNDGDSANNFLLVDDMPDDGDSTYVSAPSTGIKDTYAMDSYTLPVGWSIAAVIPMAIAKKDNASTALVLQLVARLGASETTSASKTLGTGYAPAWDRQETKPGGGAWTQTDLDDMEIGMLTA